jgi:hypothetical protein
VTALFAEHTGTHPPLEIAWAIEPRVAPAVPAHLSTAAPDTSPPGIPTAPPAPEQSPPDMEPAPPKAPPDSTARAYDSLWEFALAVNRGDGSALALAANGVDGGVPIDPAELRKLLGTVWFRGVFPRLSQRWRDRLFEVLVERVPFQNHMLRIGRHAVPLSEVSHAALDDIVMRTDLPESVRMDLQVLVAVGRLWGEHAVLRCQFSGDARARPSRLSVLLHGWRG